MVTAVLAIHWYIHVRDAAVAIIEWYSPIAFDSVRKIQKRQHNWSYIMSTFMKPEEKQSIYLLLRWSSASSVLLIIIIAIL